MSLGLCKGPNRVALFYPTHFSGSWGKKRPALFFAGVALFYPMIFFEVFIILACIDVMFIGINWEWTMGVGSGGDRGDASPPIKMLGGTLFVLSPPKNSFGHKFLLKIVLLLTISRPIHWRSSPIRRQSYEFEVMPEDNDIIGRSKTIWVENTGGGLL